MSGQAPVQNSRSPVRPGEVIASKYRVDRILGVGGMGVVLAAWHLELEQRVAIKLMLRNIAQQPEAVERFLREARASVRLRSEHAAKVFDVGRLATGEPFMVMEFLEGQDLAAVVHARTTLPIAEAVDLVAQACEAISEAHDQGITHRDLKPANLFLTRDAHGAPCVKVLDFGISKMRRPGESSSATGLTGTSVVMGTPYYMAPEQMRASKEADARSDIWALGAILFELLTGQVAYGGESITEIVAAVMTEPAPHARSLRPEIPDGLDKAIQRCFEKQPAQRFQSVLAFVAAIAEYGTSRARRSFARLGGPGSEPAGVDPALAPTDLASPRLGPSTDVSWGAGQTGIPLVRRRASAKEKTLGIAAAGVVALSAIVVLVGMRFRSGSGASAALGALSSSTVETSAPSASVSVVADAASVQAPPVAAVDAPPATSVESRDSGGHGTKRNPKQDAGGSSSQPVAGAPPTKTEPAKTEPPTPPAVSPPPTTKSGLDHGGRE